MFQFVTKVSKSIFGEFYTLLNSWKKSWTYRFIYLEIFILSEWRDKGVTVAS